MGWLNPFVTNFHEWKQITRRTTADSNQPRVPRDEGVQRKPELELGKHPFRVNIPDAVLVDLRRRLSKTRFPGDFGNDQWSYGTEQNYLSELVRYWEKDFDWRAQEQAINAFSHYRTSIEGVPIHFIHERGRGPRPIPLILSHGWPWTFWDMNKLIRPLTHPIEFGGDPRDAFDVVVPSLPGYGFSTPLTTTGIEYTRTADLWVQLMEGLGYSRFAAQGCDLGAFVTSQLGHKYANRMIGIHITFPMPLDANTKGLPPPSEYSDDEQEALQRTLNFAQTGNGYAMIQSTRPQTLSYAMHDSPAGMCAWFLEKRRDWSDCDGDVERAFTKDELLTAMTLYWVSESFNSAARFYYESTHHPWTPSHTRTPVVEAPTGVTIMPRDVVQMPRRWVEQYYNLQRWTILPAGGHFAPMEQPERLIEEIRAFFRPLRG